MASKILCCLCGISITPNEAAMCMDCLRSEVDITSEFSKDYDMVHCKKCDRWCVSRDHWVHHELESASLLAVCLRKIQGLNNIKVLDAKWVWTEPHSMRLKVNVTVQRSVLDEKLVIKQNLEVNYVIKNKQCLDCIREATEHTWGALVQVRQRRSNKSTLCVLEGIILKSGLQHTMLNIEVVREGLDFYFRSKNQADKVVDLISSAIPSKIRSSRKLVSQNKQSGEGKFEQVIFVEIAPLCKGDLVVTSRDTSGGSRGADVMLVFKLSSTVHLLSPLTGKTLEIPTVKYFTKPLQLVLMSQNMVSFVILDINIIEPKVTNPHTKSGASSSASTVTNVTHLGDSHVMAEAEICREADMGSNDITYTVLTHLGAVLKPGDTALGYDLAHTVMDDDAFSELPFERLDIILVRKSYADKVRKPNKKRMNRRRHRGGNNEQVASKGLSEGADDVNSSVYDDSGEIRITQPTYLPTLEEGDEESLLVNNIDNIALTDQQVAKMASLGSDPDVSDDSETEFESENNAGNPGMEEVLTSTGNLMNGVGSLIGDVDQATLREYQLSLQDEQWQSESIQAPTNTSKAKRHDNKSKKKT